MGKKGKRTKGIEEEHPFAGMSQVNLNAAGVDIGAAQLWIVGKFVSTASRLGSDANDVASPRSVAGA